MQFSTLIRKVELYLHVQGSTMRAMIEDFINESILDFVRLKEWRKVRSVVNLPLDGSGSYNILAVAPDFEGEIGLFSEEGIEYEKSEYDVYIQYQTKTYKYSILGTQLYVEGDTGTTLKFIYVALGTNYPLTNDADEVPATIHYWDIIKQIAVVKMLKHLGDPQVQVEETTLIDKLKGLRASENRFDKEGKPKEVQR